LTDGACAVVAADDDRDARPGKVSGEGRVGKRLADRAQRRLPSPLAGGQSKVPVLDLVAAPVPLVCPGEDEGSDTPSRERAPDLPGQCACLFMQAMPTAVESDLGQQQRSLAGKVLKACQVRVEQLRRLEVDIERDEVQERQVEVFG